MSKVILYGTCARGVFTWSHPEYVSQQLEQYHEKEVKVTVETYREKRTLRQNAYYWGVVVPLVQKGYRQLGERLSLSGADAAITDYLRVMTPEQAHDTLKKDFAYTEMYDDTTGKIFTVPKGTRDMNVEDMVEYIEQIQIWAAEFLGVVIPDPNSQP